MNKYLLLLAVALSACELPPKRVDANQNALKKVEVFRHVSYADVGGVHMGRIVLCNGDTLAFFNTGTGAALVLIGKYRGDQGPLICP